MPTERTYDASLPKLLTRQTIDVLMLGYVLGYRWISPLAVLQVTAAIEKFRDDMGLTEEDFPLDSAVRRFYVIWEDMKSFPDWAGKDKWCKLQRNKRKYGTNKSNS